MATTRYQRQAERQRQIEGEIVSYLFNARAQALPITPALENLTETVKRAKLPERDPA